MVFFMKESGDIGSFYHYAFPMQAVLVTCKDKKMGKTNVITIAWHTPISKKPPLYGISVAPSRYSHGLIEQSGEFVVNFASYDLVDKVAFCGKHSGRNIDKIKELGLSILDSQVLDTPILKDCFAHLECRLFEKRVIGDHSFFIGEIVNILYDKDCFSRDVLNNDLVHPCFYLGDNLYTKIDKTREEY